VQSEVKNSKVGMIRTEECAWQIRCAAAGVLAVRQKKRYANAGTHDSHPWVRISTEMEIIGPERSMVKGENISP